VNAATQLAVVTLVVLSVPAVWGWQVAWALVFPLGFLFFAVPIGEFLLPALMMSTADFTVLALRASGIPVYREGLQFVIPSGMWSVVEACSGIRYLIASVTVGALFAHLNYTGWRKRALFMGVAIAVPLVANWLRAYMIVMLGHYSGNTLATGVDHLIYGWVFFGVVIMVMFMVGARWADPAPALTPAAAGSGAPHGVAAATPQQWAAMLVVLVLAAWPLGAERVMQGRVNPLPVQAVAVQGTLPWQPVNATTQPQWVPRYKHPSATSHGRWVATPDTPWVGVYLHHYRQQNYERKLVSSVNTLVDSEKDDWSQQSTGQAMAPLPGAQMPVQAAVLRAQGGGLMGQSDRLRVWRFYWVNGRYVAADARAKLWGAWGLLQGQGDDGAIVTLYTLVPAGPQGPDVTAADQRLASFLQAQMGAIDLALLSTHQGR
jgi:EpsI family protein